MLAISFMLKIIKNINMRREVLTIVGERLPGYLQGQQNQLAKRSTCKYRRAKIHKLTNAQIDASLTKIAWITKSLRAYV